MADSNRPVVMAVQMDIAWKDKAANHAKVRQMLQANRPAKGALVVLPEMFATGFCMDVAEISETGSANSEKFLAELAREYGVYLVAGLVTTGKDGRGHNEAVVYGPSGEIVDRYHKIQPFSGGETANYSAGDRLVHFEWQGLRVSPFVCFDLRFPEHFRRAAKQGADLMLVIASWPVARIGHWVTLLQARAIENQCYVVGVNRVGQDPFLPYNGQSLIVDFSGAVVADAGEKEAVIRAELDAEALTAYRLKLPFLAEMRDDRLAVMG
jgi:predicted amidohydrolase